MQSRRGDEYDFEDWASVNGRLPPWSDDETTTAWSPRHWAELRRHERATTRANLDDSDAVWLDTSTGWDDAPIVLSIEELTPPPAYARAPNRPPPAPRPPSAQTRPGRPVSPGHRSIPPLPPRVAHATASRQPTARMRLEATQPPARTTTRGRGQAAAQFHAAAAQASQQLAAQVARQQQVHAAAAQASQQLAAQAARQQQMHAAAARASQQVARQQQMHAAQRAPAQPAATTAQLRPVPAPQRQRPAMQGSVPSARPRLAQPAPSLRLEALEPERDLERPSLWKAVFWYALAASLGLVGAEYFASGTLLPQSPAARAPATQSSVSAATAAPVSVEPAQPTASEVASTLPSERSAAVTSSARRANEKSGRHAVSQPTREPSEPSEPAAPRAVEANPVPAKAEPRPAPEAPAPAPSQSSQPGTLRINSRPWSQVFVDGRLVGNTPQQALHLSPGSHEVRLVNPEFAMSKTFSVNISAGESLTRVEQLGGE